jgi:tetratricopeptide (TPR) repeat protein
MRALLIVLLVCMSTQASGNEMKRKTLLSSLDPKSVSQNLAFYQLYPDTNEGQTALQRAWGLISGSPGRPSSISALPSPEVLQALIALVNKQPEEKPPKLSPRELATINQLSRNLKNRQLKGYGVSREEEVLRLPPEEIDLARGLFLSQLGRNIVSWDEIYTYEAMMDLMALQIRARLGPSPKPEKVVKEMNRFVFEEMEFRFPPHSVYSKDIDLYTFLPNVLDSRRGVCLGVSILYLCLAQRLGVPLEIITPPGHIYVRYRQGSHIINIETTARGIDIESEAYLGMNTRSLQQRNLKETIGFAHVNQASIYLNKEHIQKARECYEIAMKYIQNDCQISELYAYSLILTGDKEEGLKILEKTYAITPDYAVKKEPLSEDLLLGRTDEEGLYSCFRYVDDQRKSLIEKKEKLEATLKKQPLFRSGWLNLATTLMQLHREGEALDILKKLHKIDPENPTVEYMLTVLSAKRFEFDESWRHLHRVEGIVLSRGHMPRALKELKKQLSILYPE